MQIDLLGPLRIENDGGVIDIGSGRRRALVAVLALRPGRVVSVDQLIEDVWGTAPPPNAVATLQSHVSHLRRVLPDVIVTRRPGYVLDVDPMSIDATRFERLVTAGEIALREDRADDALTQLDTALALWRGPALSDLTDLPFVREAVSHLDELRRLAEEDRSEAALALGRHAELISSLRELVQAAPLRERRTRLLALALYRSDLQVDALAAFKDLRQSLVEELGIDPSPDLRRLEEAILLQRADLDWRPPTGRVPETSAGLDLPSTSFFGRDRDITNLLAMLESPRVVTLVGPPGSGKTRLALETVARLVNRSVHVVELSSIAANASDVVTVGIADALGARQLPGQAIDAAVASCLADDDVVVLDNCEHIVEAVVEVVASLRAARPGLTVLATSRRRLPIDRATEVEVGPLSEDAAVELMADRARIVRSRFALTSDARRALQATARSLDSLPLALELAAARLAVLDPGQLAERVKDAIALLGRSDDDGDRRSHLGSTLRWSYELLAPDEQVLLQRLVPFIGGVTLETIEAACSEGLASSALDVVERLRGASLLAADDGTEGLRFRLLEPIRQFASGYLDDDDRDAIFRRLLTHLPTLASLARGREFATLRQVLAWAVEPGREVELPAAVQLTAAAGPVWIARGLISDGRTWTERVLASADGVAGIPAALLATVEMHAGNLCQLSGDVMPALAHFETAVALSDVGGNPLIAAQARFIHASIHHAINGGDPRADFEACAQAARDVGSDNLLMGVLNALGVANRRAGDLTGARAAMEEALHTARRLGDPMAIGVTLINLGDIRHAQDDADDARARYREALDLARENELARVVVAATGALGFIESDPASAVELLTESVDAARATGEAQLLCVSLANLADAQRRNGQGGEARSTLESVRVLAEQIGDVRNRGNAEHGLAALALASNDLDGAWRSVTAAAADRRAAGDRIRVLESLELAGVIALRRGNTDLGVRVLAAAGRERAATDAPHDADVAALIEEGLRAARPSTPVVDDLDFDAAVDLVIV